MGHEFCCEVVEVGPDVNNLAVGDVVVSMPVAFDASGRPRDRLLEQLPGRLRGADGAQRDDGDQGADRPAGRMAALTEPLAVGVHAVAKSRRSPAARRAIVIGLGPVGLACIAD